MRAIHEDYECSVGAMFRLNGGGAEFLNMLMAVYGMTLNEAHQVYWWLRGRPQPKPDVLTRGAATVRAGADAEE